MSNSTQRACLCAIIFFTAGGSAVGQDEFVPDLQVSIFPAQPVPGDEVSLHIFVSNVAVAAGATYAPTVDIDGNSIFVNLNYHSREYLPGEPRLPSAFLPDETISLGQFSSGSYSLTTVFNIDQTEIATRNTMFAVVPEPSSAFMCLIGALLCSAFRDTRLIPLRS